MSKAMQQSVSVRAGISQTVKKKNRQEKREGEGGKNTKQAFVVRARTEQ